MSARQGRTRLPCSLLRHARAAASRCRAKPLVSSAGGQPCAAGGARRRPGQVRARRAPAALAQARSTERMRGGPGATMRGGKARAHLRAAAAAGSCMVGQLSPAICIAQPCAHRWGRAGIAWCGHAESHVCLALVGLLHQSPTLCQPEGLRLNFSAPVGNRLATC